MSVTLVVKGTPYEYPVAGDEPGWGGPATGWSEAVTEALADLLGDNDILETTFTVANNQAVAANVNGLIFNTGTVRSADIEYSVYRVSTGTPSGKAETGTMKIIYDNSAAPGSQWLLGISPVGNSGVSFSITDAGQFQYTSTDIGAAGYSGVLTFRAKTFEQ